MALKHITASQSGIRFTKIKAIPKRKRSRASTDPPAQSPVSLNALATTRAQASAPITSD
jgi:hypothetical protein